MTPSRAQLLGSSRRLVREGDRVLKENPELFDQLVDELVSVALWLFDTGVGFAADPILSRLEELRKAHALLPQSEAWRLNLVALRGLEVGDLRLMTSALDDALQVASTVDDRNLLANTEINRGIAAMLSGQVEDAIGHYQRAKKLNEGEDRDVDRKIAIDLAQAYLELKDVEKAGEQISAARDLASSKARSASIVGVEGLIAVAKGDLNSAEEKFRESGRIARRAGDLRAYLIALQNQASLALDRGNPGLATRRLRAARRVASKVRDYAAWAGIERALATALARSGRRTEAVRQLEGARRQARHRGDRVAWAQLTADLGAGLLLAGDGDRAIPLLGRAVDSLVREGAEKDALQAIRNRTIGLVDLGRVRRAERSILESLDRLELRDADYADALDWYAGVLLDRKYLEEAEQGYLLASLRHVAAGIHPSDALAEAGTTFAIANQLRSAIRFFTRAIAEHSPVAAVSRYQLLNDRALALILLDEPKPAEQDLNLALKLATRAHDRAMRLVLLGNLAEAAMRLGDTSRAATYARSAALEAEAMGDRAARAEALSQLAVIAETEAGTDGARGLFAESLRLSRREHAAGAEITSLAGLARNDATKKRFRSAAKRYQAAVRLARTQGELNWAGELVGDLMEIQAAGSKAEAFEESLQDLINLVQEDNASVEAAIASMARAGATWFTRSAYDEAADTYAASILLALTEGGPVDRPHFTRLLATAILRPFISAKDAEVSLEVTEQLLRARLSGPLGERSSLIFPLLVHARETAAG